LPVLFYRTTDSLLVRAVHYRLAPPAGTRLQPLDAFLLVPAEPFAHGVLLHLRPLAYFGGGHPVRLQKYGKATHPEAVFLSLAVSTFEFPPLCFA